jgi:hypothetical protein
MIIIEIFILLILIYGFSNNVLVSNDKLFLNKLYTFFFVFLIQFSFNIVNDLIEKKNISIYDNVDICIKKSLIAVIAFDTFTEMNCIGYFQGFTNKQKSIVITLLIVCFITVVQILQLLIVN